MKVSKKSQGGLWISLLISMAIKDVIGLCSKPSLSKNAVLDPSDILWGSFDEKSTVALQCLPGFEPTAASPQTLTCEGGQWKPAPGSFICEKLTCRIPGDLRNGRYEFLEGIEFGALMRAVCNEGYHMVGDSTRSCQANGEWTGTEPVCEAVTCGLPPSIPSGQVQFKSGQELQYVCSPGFTLRRDSTTTSSDRVRCLGNGSWSKEPQCVAVTCNIPNIPHARRVEGGYGPYGYKAVVRYECNEGFKMVSGTSQMVCLENGWSSMPKCEAVSCFTPNITNARRVEGGSGPYYGYKTTVRYECNEGFKMVSGSSKMVCLENGWSSTLKCEADCTTPLGLESRRIPDEKMTASSVLSKSLLGRTWEPHYARLDNWGRINAWSPATNDRLQWLQVDLDKSKRVTGIITQGAKDYGTVQYISAFKIAYSNYGSSWTVLKDPTTNLDKIFQGNSDNDGYHTNFFEPPFYARYVRFLPWEWHERITLRMELLGCDQ